MLPTKLLSLDAPPGALVPRYLGTRDEVWVRELASELDALVGASAAELDAAFEERIAENAIVGGASWKAVAGVRHICMRLWRLRAAAPLPPPAVRRIVFEEAAAGRSRSAAIAVAAERLGASPERVQASLFADRPDARRLVAPAQPITAHAIVERYNLALLQGLLLLASELVVVARQHVRSVVRFAKLKRLLCTFDADADALRIAISGPLSILRHTTKYGHALASFLPAVAATPGWRIEARCKVADREGIVRASSADPIGTTHALPRATDSRVEERLLRDVRRLGSAWTIARETSAVRAADKIFFPDFTLTRGADRVLVEIVGFYTPEYLRSKLNVLRAAGRDDIIVCIDDSLACGDEAPVAGAVLRYSRRVDAEALVRAADRVAAACRSRDVRAVVTGTSPGISQSTPAVDRSDTPA